MTQPDFNDWMDNGRRRIKERLDEGDEEYREFLKEEYPYVYWGWEFTPDPPDDVAEELGLDE